MTRGHTHTVGIYVVYAVYINVTSMKNLANVHYKNILIYGYLLICYVAFPPYVFEFFVEVTSGAYSYVSFAAVNMYMHYIYTYM